MRCSRWFCWLPSSCAAGIATPKTKRHTSKPGSGAGEAFFTPPPSHNPSESGPGSRPRCSGGSCQRCLAGCGNPCASRGAASRLHQPAAVSRTTRSIMSGQPQHRRTPRLAAQPAAVLREPAAPGCREGAPLRLRPRPGNGRNAPVAASLQRAGRYTPSLVCTRLAQAPSRAGTAAPGGMEMPRWLPSPSRISFRSPAPVPLWPELPSAHASACSSPCFCVRVLPAGAYDSNCPRPADGYPV